MRRFSYWLCFALVALSSLLGYGSWLLASLGIRVPWLHLLFLFTSFGSLVPQMLAPLLPWFVAVGLGLVMLFLVARRLWLLVARRERVPHSYTGLPKVLGYIAACSFVLAVVVLLLSILIRAGSGVAAGMLAWPAVLCVPWAFFLTEVLSFRKPKPTTHEV